MIKHGCFSVRLAALLATLLLASCAQLQTTPTAAKDWSTTNTLMVVVEDPRSDRQRNNLGGPGYQTRLHYADDPALTRRVQSIARDHDLTVLTQWPVRNLKVLCFLIEKPSAEVLTRLEQDPRVKWVQPFNEFSLSTDPSNSQPVDRVQHFTQQHPESGAGIRVAVIDTAADRTHPDLTRAMLQQHDFVGARDTSDAESHGTAVVGLIAARPHTDRGVRGLARNADVDLLRACWQEDDGPGKCNTLTLALALDAAIDLQPDILNLSLSGRHDRVLQALIEKLVQQGVLIIAAYDEVRQVDKRFPAPEPGIVYAYGHNGRAGATPMPQAAGSEATVISAPREAFTTTPAGGYDLVSGHSIAAPQIAAIAACLMQRHPDSSRADIQAQLKYWLLGG